MEWNEPVGTALSRPEVLVGIVLAPLCPSAWRRIVRDAFEDLERARCNVLHLLEHQAGDPQTVTNCLSWAQRHIERASGLLTALMLVTPFAACREYIQRELTLLGEVADDLAAAERHADDPGALASFLMRAEKHIESAMGIHTHLMERMQSGTSRTSAEQ